MWESDYKESWVLKNWCFWTVVLEKTLEGSLDCKEIQPVHPKGNQSWIFIGRTDAKVETPIICHLMRRLTHLKRPWCWERLEAGGEGDDRGWDGWMASPTWWTSVWASSGRWWRTGKPAVHGVANSWIQLSDWATTSLPLLPPCLPPVMFSYGPPSRSFFAETFSRKKIHLFLWLSCLWAAHLLQFW